MNWARRPLQGDGPAGARQARHPTGMGVGAVGKGGRRGGARTSPGSSARQLMKNLATGVSAPVISSSVVTWVMPRG